MEIRRTGRLLRNSAQLSIITRSISLSVLSIFLVFNFIIMENLSNFCFCLLSGIFDCVAIVISMIHIYLWSVQNNTRGI